MKKFLHFGIVASIYIFIYVICRQFFFIGKPYHLYTPDWTAKNILLIAAIISTAPALIGWKKYPYITAIFYSFGIVLDELFGSQMVVMDHNLPPMPYHYGFAWYTITINGMPQITICHGSPYNTNEKLLTNNDRTYEIMDTVDSSIILSGHTHIQNKIEHNGKIVLNAGSVGVPLHSNGKSQFLILHGMDKKWTEEFISLEYDVDKVIEELHESGLDKHAPYWCRVTENLLCKGNLSHGTVLAKAMSLCSAETGNCIWPDIPEKYWKQAVEEMIDLKF